MALLGHDALSESPISALSGGGGGPFNYTLTSSFTGVATWLSAAFLPVSYTLSSSFTGVATFGANLLQGGTAFYTLDSSFTGTSSWHATNIQLQYAFGEVITGLATLIAPVLHGNTVARGQALLFGNLDQFRQVNNPVYSGDLIDQTNLSKLRFTVNSTVCSFTDSAKWNLLDMRFTYDGKEATFSEIVTPTIGHPSFNPEQTAQIELDFGSGLKTYFKGKIRSRRHEGVNNNEQIVYSAVGYQSLADDITVVSTDGVPRVEFSVPTTIYLGSSTGTTVPYPIADAVQFIFTHNSAALTAAGIPTAIGSPGLENLTGNLADTLQITNSGFGQTISQIVGFQPGVKVYFDDIQQAWTFPNLLNAPTMIVRVESSNIQDLIYEASTADRYTAVLLYGEPTLDDIATHANTKTGGTIGRATISLQPYWNTLLEPTWTCLRGAAGNSPSELEDEYFWVYRRFKIPSDAVNQHPGTPLECMAKIERWGQTKYVRIKGKPNFRRRTFTANYPVLNDGDPYLPGDARPSSDLQLTYWPFGCFAFTFTNSSGTPTGTSLTAATSTYVSLRYPETGFQGTAYDLFNVQRVFTQVVPLTEVTTITAQSMLNTRKDVVLSGSIPIDGDPIEYAINLNAKLLVQHGTQSTGLNSFSALVTGYRYQFGKRGRSDIEINTDVAALVRI